MSETAETDLHPAELDLLEDALEELELEGALERWAQDELAPRVHERLLDYRNVLAAARQALPLEDVPAGVLDEVLAQARQAAASPAGAVIATQEPWWARLRRSFMVPALALTGTAALMLWVLVPKDRARTEEPPAGSAGSAGSGPASKAEQAAPARADVLAREPMPAATPVETVTPAGEAAGVDASAAAPNDDARRDMQLEAELDNDKDEASAEGGRRGLTSQGDAPGGVMGASGAAKSTPTTQTKAGGSIGPATGRWDIVERGDRARQAGDCVAARDEYALALEDDEPAVRARAFAGLGLCDAAAGDEASADANYERARGLDDGVGSFIESQSQRSRGASEKKRKPAKKSKVAADAFDDANDPF